MGDFLNSNDRFKSRRPEDHLNLGRSLQVTNTRTTSEKELTSQWATLDELLDKLMFLAVSGDDPTFITHFLLIYRRFATPRSVLLAMQKRMRQLNNPSGDPMFACFAQMRICNLLETWIRSYPYDFAVQGTSGALNALMKSIISKTHLLHYGSEFLRFLEILPTLVDLDASWSFKSNAIADESDDAYSIFDEEEEVGSGASTTKENEKDADPNRRHFENNENVLSDLQTAQSRERKASLPLPKSLICTSPSSSAYSEQQSNITPAKLIKDLTKLSQEIMLMDSEDVAQEITRLEAGMFLDIKPRHWLRYTFLSGKKDEEEPISAFNATSNHLATWVVSLILCHDKPKARVRQIEKFVEIGQRLRTLNNYSALRAFVAGINNATYAGDPAMDQFKSKLPEHAKNLQSWDVLLQQIRAHRAYRLALRNTKGACIPALEVHMTDLLRAQEGNDDSHPSDSNKIHWGKFNMMGRFITTTIQCQAQCLHTNDYTFPERRHIMELIAKPVMSLELQKSRMAESDEDDFDFQRGRIPAASQPKDISVLRKIFFG